MRFYLCARYGRRQEMATHAAELHSLGHQVVSRWILGRHEAADGDTTRWADFAEEDIDDVRRCEALVAFTETGAYPRGSRHVEFGMALAQEKKVVVIGPVENIFHTLPPVVRFGTWQEFVEAITDA